MMRRALSALTIALAASCAPVAAPPPAAPQLVAAYGGRTAPTHPALVLCESAYAFNVGPVAYDGTLIAYTPLMQTAAGPVLRFPTDAACLSSAFGFRPEDLGGGRTHSGIDLANPDGGFVYAAAPGRVITAGWRGTYGLCVEIDHGHGVRTRYGHLSEIGPEVVPGATVAGGSAIGLMGQTGDADGVHLHYEVFIGRDQVDPLLYGRG